MDGFGRIDWDDVRLVSSENIVMGIIDELTGFRNKYYSIIENNDLKIKKINDDHEIKKRELSKKINDKKDEISSEKNNLEIVAQRRRDESISKIKAQKDQNNEKLVLKIKDINSKISDLRIDCDIKVNKILKLINKANEIKSSLELGRNAKLFFEIENNQTPADFLFVEKRKALEVDYSTVQAMVDLFNSETGLLKKRIASEHGTQLWSFLNWLYYEINKNVEEIVSCCNEKCSKLESQKNTLNQENLTNNASFDSRLQEINNKFQNDISVIKKDMELAMATSSDEFDEQDNMLDEKFDKSIKSAIETSENDLSNLIASFEKSFEDKFPIEKIKEYFEYHMTENMLDFGNYACASEMPECYEIGMSEIKIGEYIVCNEQRDFLENNYSLIVSDDTIRVPISLSFFDNKSMVYIYDVDSNDDVINDIQFIAASILLNSPAGTINFVCIDPLKASNTFAPFNKFVDYNKATNKLLTGGIATTSVAIKNKLSVVSDHIEHVISSCLQSSDMSIQEYNKLAGSNAEPYQVLLVMDFPASFSHENIKQLERIIESGPRCGVYTILFSSRAQLAISPDGTTKIIDNIMRKSIVFNKENNLYTNNTNPNIKFRIWNMVSDDILNTVVPAFKKGVEDAGRIIVGFSDIIKPNDWFVGDSTDNLEVPIGQIGVGNLQNFLIGGEGVTHHALIVGNTGSGKTTLLHTLINSMMIKYSYEELSIYLLDFKHGVEFKCYGEYNLPNIKLVAIESDRKYGYDVIHRINSEMKRRSELFKEVDCENITSYRRKTEKKIPRILLIIDEYQVLFDSKKLDYISAESSEMLQRLLEQGRGFGIHVILSTQNIEAATNFNAAAYNQIAIRIALMCTSNVSKIALGESAGEANLLIERGMAVYNYNAGAKQCNTIFRVAFLDNRERNDILMSISEKYKKKGIVADTEVVDSHIEKNKEHIDNYYFSLCKRMIPKRAEEVRRRIVVPFGIDDNNNLVYCDFEKNNFASYIMGTAGSGKSVLLDDIIVGILMNYHPDEVELWLIDFMKTGFSKYAKKCPPHIKNIILGNSDEMVFGVIDKLYQLMEERKDLFSSRGWNDITDVPVGVYMPVVFVIIDEFAEMSQIISETRANELENNYVLKLENLLREGRKLGFKFIFASQSFNNGMNGLSPAAKDQIQMRMALKNSVAEINDTLALTPIQRNDMIDNYVATLPPYKTLIKTHLTDSNDNYIVQVNRINNLKIESKDIDEYMDELNTAFNVSAYSDKLSDTEYVNKEPFLFTGNIPKTYMSQVPLFEKYEREELINDDEYDDDDVVLYPGTPQGFNGIKTIFLHRDACENIIMAGGDVATISNTILAFKEECKRAGVKVTLWTDSRNILYRKYIKNKFAINNICKGIDEICMDIGRINDKKDADYSKDELIIMLGIRNLFDEFELYDEDNDENDADTNDSLLSDINQEFELLMDAWNQVISDPDKRENINMSFSVRGDSSDVVNVSKGDFVNKTYDARNDINKLLKTASKRGKHFVVYFGNISDFKSIRPDMRLYKHKLLFSMSQEFQYEFNERSLNRMEPTELLYVGNSSKYKSNVFVSRDISIGGFHVDEEGNVVS
ncbi:MAG: FtsK/SpoIIIE domain-containing protein [Clostridium sp.]|nr:FtsK/SpoIIIE domain-containing protein [Clostridium sp.]MCM1207301.1 FtsK/SpoIIIE domain-containing protein [Ruminococcus sp.]